IQHPTPLRDVNFDAGIGLILRGLVKKVVLADNLAPLVAQAFARPGQLGPLSAWVAVLAFAAQIYGDFSGYTDMGRGSALLLGYSVPQNFASPYQSANTAEFWHRWHMSLSTWLRDYLYIPLGGSRSRPVRVYLNLMITMALGGLWHGASWHFLVWGVYEGGLLAFHRLWQSSVGRAALYRRVIALPPVAFLCRPVTLIFVCAGWVFFRADTLGGAFAMLRSMVAFDRAPEAGLALDPGSTPVLLLLLAGAIVVSGWLWAVARPYAATLATRAAAATQQPCARGTEVPAHAARFARIPATYTWARAQLDAAWLRSAYVLGLRPVAFVAAVALLVIWPPHAVQRFIYFQF
ncbi:MAG: MBOAT family O-acyltransferase, partial [Ktedonobacterales bacterium]